MTPSMRLSTIRVPSSPGALRQTRMPPLPALWIVLPEIFRPRASIEKIAASSRALSGDKARKSALPRAAIIPPLS
jgi:hypothetical protein